ncbi:MAG: hypothetical protein AAGL49_15265, partial [Pseudomonadota bacterium]
NCEMDDVALHRDVVYSVDAEWLPQDAYVRLSQNGRYKGAGWFRFTESLAEAEVHTAEYGRLRQRMELDAPAPTFAAHPVSTDAWQTAAFDKGAGERIQHLTGCLNPSPLADGSSGPMLHMTDKHMEHVGAARIETPAGAFDTEHFRIHPRDFDTPLEIYVWGEDRVLVRIVWAHLRSRYDLVELETLEG